MKLDVVFTPLGLQPADAAGRTVFVIDILRATTTICAALHHGARAVIPVAVDARRRSASRRPSTAPTSSWPASAAAVPIPGFALGNSPLEMTAEAVRGKTIIMTTTNGTPRPAGHAGRRQRLPRGRRQPLDGRRRGPGTCSTRDGDLLILCAGRERSFALDDAYAAGRLLLAALSGRPDAGKGLNDAALASLDFVRRYGTAWERPLRASRGGADLAALGFDADIVDAAREDAYPVLSDVPGQARHCRSRRRRRIL